MTKYVWCHGPNCHRRSTTTRVRGVKGSKVLRTVKIALNNYRSGTIWKYFCDQTCMHQFIAKHIDEFVQLHPRTEALETPVTVTKEDNINQYYNYVRTNIEVDESRNIG